MSGKKQNFNVQKYLLYLFTPSDGNSPSGRYDEPKLSMTPFMKLNNIQLVDASIFSDDDEYREEVRSLVKGEKPFSSPSENRAFGAIYGMIVGDAMGARLEFEAVRYDERTLFGMGSGKDGRGKQCGGAFQLKPGQWTDDSSMGLCVADSFLCNGGQWRPHDCIQRFLAWWNCGLNNAFRFDYTGHRNSVGLDEMISQSFSTYPHMRQCYTSAGNNKSSDNGSVMRLAPVPVVCHIPATATTAYEVLDLFTHAEEIARLHSYTTHRGDEAAECCALLTHIMVRCIRGERLRDVLETLERAVPVSVMAMVPASSSSPPFSTVASSSSPSSPSSSTSFSATSVFSSSSIPIPVPVSTIPPFTSRIRNHVAPSVLALACSQCEVNPDTGEADPNRNWNWRIRGQYHYSPERARRQPGYVGSYAMDATCMALNIAWRTSIGAIPDVAEALLIAANICGDADSVGSVVGQLVGAAYGVSAFPQHWLETVTQWDHFDTGLRAYRLFHRRWVWPMVGQEEKKKEQEKEKKKELEKEKEQEKEKEKEKELVKEKEQEKEKEKELVKEKEQEKEKEKELAKEKELVKMKEKEKEKEKEKKKELEKEKEKMPQAKNPNPLPVAMPLSVLSSRINLLDGNISGNLKYGDYMLEECIGEGAQGRVYIAKHFQTGEVRVIKAIVFSRKKTETGKKTDGEKMVDAEVQIGTQYGKLCPFLVDYEEVAVRGSECYIVMEYCTGGNLRKVLDDHMEQKKPFEKEEVARLLFEIGTGIQALHAGDVVHRDIKPENIFLGEKGAYKLGDYGTARILTRSGTMTLVGTQGYMAPEILQGETNYEKSVDVYSFGCILFEMIVLAHPFKNEKGNLNIMNVCAGNHAPIKAEIRARYTEAFVTLVQKMISVDSSARPTIEEVLFSAPVFAFLAKSYVLGRK